MGSDWRDGGRRTILVLSADEDWWVPVDRAARCIGVDILHATGPAEDAIRLLASCDRQFSHFLVHPRVADHLLPDFVSLTAGERGSGVSLILLGPPGDRAAPLANMHVHIVAEPDMRSLERALAADVVDADADAPTVALSQDELREAITEARIALRYQPIVRLGDHVPIGVEVLARLEHPSHGTLPADQFIPAMEDIGLAWPLTRAVMQRAFQEWRQYGLARHGLKLGLNLPLDVFFLSNALVELDAGRHAAGIAASSIVLELTESRVVERVDELRGIVTDLRERGYGVVIDDIGPRQRDHRALLDLAFSTVKLDLDVVHDARTDPVARDFLMNAVASAHAAGRLIVAEGVEDAELWGWVRAAGVDLAQGFHIAAPLPAIAIEPWLASWRRMHHLPVA